MKRLLLALLALGTMSSFAQKDIYLRIMHQWDGQPFAFNTTATTSGGDDIRLNRLEYYVSGIKIYHDGGQLIDLPTTYILANAANQTQVNLGTQTFTTIDSISFAIGVDQAANHADPAQYNASHPLAPKSPSMHWGWTAGYRFAAVEGMAGASGSDVVEIHALGDNNYMSQTVVTSGTEISGALVIQLDAEYLNGFDNISMSGGMIVHGETGAAVTLLSNYADSVFTESQQSVNPVSLEENEVGGFRLAPNPATIGNARVEFGKATEGTLRVLDLTGRVIYTTELNGNSDARLPIQNEGVYLVEVTTSTYRVAQRLVIQ